MHLVLFGCSGFIGRALIPYLLDNGHHLTIISRKASNKLIQPKHENHLNRIQLNPVDPTSWTNEELLKALEKAEGVINLVGEPIAEKRWTNPHCEKIKASRIESTKLLVNTLRDLKRPPRTLINASAIGFYGTSQDKEFTENSPCGDDFLATLCADWEKAASTKPKATRLVVLRIGIVLGGDGGALGKMLPVFKAGFGGPIGNGLQWMSWIHRKDLCQIIEASLLKRQCSGVFNAVAPDNVTMKDFANALGKSLSRPSLLPVPGALLKLLLGDGAQVVLKGQKVTSIKLQKLGVKLKYPTLYEALKDCVGDIK